MFGIGGFELFLILVFGFLIFGPDKLPEIARTVGRAIAKFRGAQEEMKETLNTQAFIDKDSDEVFKNPLDVLENAASGASEKVKSAQAKADDIAGNAADAVNEKVASFAERKAKYDRERAERKKAEAEAVKAAETAATESVATAEAAKESDPEAKKPELSADEPSDAPVKTAEEVS